MRRLMIAAATAAAALSLTASALADTLHVETSPFGLDAIDPALSFTTMSWQIQYATCVKLYNYPDRATTSAVPQPEAALVPPFVSPDGLWYTFVVLPGVYRFAPPSNEAVTASTFKRSFERALAPGVGAPASQPPAALFASDIVGVTEYSAGLAPSISGIRVIGPILSIHLTRRAPDLLARLAMPFFCAVPSNAAPPSPTTIVTGAGPYTVVSSNLNGTTVLQRNPNYRGKRPHVYGEIDVTVPTDPSTTIDRVASNGVGYASSLPVPQYATFPRPDARLSVNPALGFRYIRFNTTRSRFDTANERKAVALALDRTRLASEFGAFAGTPTDQILPPGMPGYLERDLFPLGSPTPAQLATAGTLLGPGPSTVELYVGTAANPVNVAVAADIQAELAALGLTVTIHHVGFFALQGLQATDPWDMLVNGWIADYDDPYDVINVLVGPGSAFNVGGFSDPVLSPAVTAAAALSGSARTAAYADLDLQLSRDALPIAPFTIINSRDVFSLHVGCQTYVPPFGMDLAALCPIP